MGRVVNEILLVVYLALEVTVQFIDASSHNLIAKCSAEGFGGSEVEDIRQAIDRCLQSLM